MFKIINTLWIAAQQGSGGIPISISGLMRHVFDAESTFENLAIKAGVVIAMISIITGTYIISNALYRLSSDNMQDRYGTGKRIAAGSALIVFSLIIGIIIFTIYSASTQASS